MAQEYVVVEPYPYDLPRLVVKKEKRKKNKEKIDIFGGIIKW